MNIVESAISNDDRTVRSQRLLPLVAKHVSPPGALGLDPHLDARRVKYWIPDEAFKIPAVYERIFVVQVEEFDSERFGPDSLLVRPQTTQIREFNSMPRGVVISAGLQSRDILYSHGMEVGDLVWILQLGIYRLPYLRVGSEDMHMMVLQIGDIVGAEDTYARLQSGELDLVRDVSSNGHVEHFYRRPGTTDCKPKAAFIPADM